VVQGGFTPHDDQQCHEHRTSGGQQWRRRHSLSAINERPVGHPCGPVAQRVVNIQDTILASVPRTSLLSSFLPYLGDYDYLLSVGNEFRGVFCANNTPDRANFPSGVTYQRAADSVRRRSRRFRHRVAISIDPFYFSVPVIP